MTELETLFSKALDDFHNRQFSSAETTLKKINKIQRGIPDVLHLMGLVALETDQPKRAVDLFRQLIKTQPGNAAFHALYGSAQLLFGKPKQAVTAFQKAIDTDSDNADYYYNRALADLQTEDQSAAEVGFSEALRRAPDHQDARFNLGQLLRRNGRFSEALVCLEVLLNDDGEAVDTLTEVGESLIGLTRFEEASVHLRKATSLSPNFIPALNALGIACFYLEHYEEAERALRQALALAPDSYLLHNSLGNLLQRLGHLSEAEQCFRDAIAAAPDNNEATLNLAGLLLLRGAYEEGWQLYRHVRNVAYRGVNIRNRWEGGDLTGKTVRVYGDQGIGDVVMFAGLLPDLQTRSKCCVVEIDKRLEPVFQRSFPDLKIVGRPPASPLSTTRVPIDAETTFSDLPRHLKPDLNAASKPARAYLKADPAKSAELRRRYTADNDVFLIGIAWRSYNAKRPERNVLLPLWGPILAQPKARFISLQYGDTAADIAEAKQRHGVSILSGPRIDQTASLDDFASQISALDLVICISQSSAHLAGALGKNVLTMIPNVPDWRYRLTGDETVWYPNMRLYRQSALGVWDDVIETVAADIAQYL